MNSDPQPFTGEIASPIPLNFKIPKFRNASESANQTVNQFNPMEYYSTPSTTDRSAPKKPTPPPVKPPPVKLPPVIPPSVIPPSVIPPPATLPPATLPPPPPPPSPPNKKRKLEDNGGQQQPTTTFYRPPCDESLPAELTKLMLPLSCELCSATLNSTITAKIHYDGKPHDKKVNAWLLEWSSRTGEPIPKREKINDGPSGPNAFHCELCDLPLTSLQHANQHYTGKRHRMTLAGRSNPHGSGYYGPDGKWIRTQTKVSNDPSGRFHIGETFLPPNTVEANSEGTPVVIDPERYCNICNISVTSQPQMKLHLEGSKHAKKLKAIGAPPHVSDSQDTILHSLEKKNPKTTPAKRDISIYRTPSGYFYCKPCDVTIPNEVLFNQHLDGKKHIKASVNAANTAK